MQPTNLTQTQEETIKRLTEQGWKLLKADDSSVKGGPMPMVNPAGERYLVLPDGTLTANPNPKE